MPTTKKTAPKKKRTHAKKTSWKNLARDSRGRWVKSKKTQLKSTKSSVTIKKAVKKRTDQKKATKILNQIQHDFSVDCPRCGGNLKSHRIRCGPDRLVSVKKCKICNYWIPNPST